MEQIGFMKNISGTVCVIGIALSAINANDTMIVNGYYDFPKAHYSSYNEAYSNMNKQLNSNIFYERRSSNRLENEANSLFGTMRDATKEELESVNRYIKSISKKTGVNFFDIC